MYIQILSETRNKLLYLLPIIFLCSGYFNYSALAESVLFFFRISSLTGQVLVNKFLSICNCTFDVLKLTYSFFQILYEDSLIFVKDATEKFTFAIHLLKELCLFLEGLGWNLLNLLIQILDGIFSFFGFVQGAVGTVKNGLHLTGSTIWRFFANIPETVVSNLTGMIEFVRCSFNEVIISIWKVKDCIIQGLGKTYKFLFDIPLDSVYGLIIGAVILIILCIKFRDICCIISSGFFKLYRQAVSFGISLWNGRFLESRVTPNNDYSFEEDERLCIVCQYRPKEIIIFPCKHLCLCNECSKQLEKNQPICPICRSEITGTLKVYL